MYKYKEIINELVDKKLVEGAEIFDYNNDSIAEIYDRYFQYCQKALTEYSLQFNIQPARIFFRNDYSVNAMAGMIGDFYLIKINMGLIDILYRAFCESNNLFKENNSKDIYAHLTMNFDVPLEYIMFQFATYFTFYHEQGHLIQKSSLLNSFLNERNIDGDSGYSSFRHSLEFDADLHAAHCLVFIIVEYIKKLPESNYSTDVINGILALATASVFINFMYFEEKYHSIYYKESTHPHPVIRITYILDVIASLAPLNFKDIKIDGNLVLIQCFEIAERFCQVQEMRDMVNVYAEMYQTERLNIEKFINETLILESDAIPQLIKNRPNYE